MPPSNPDTMPVPQHRPLDDAAGAVIDTPWSIGADEVLSAAGTTGAGRSTAQVEALLDRHGPNELTAQPPTPLWRRFVDQFRSVLIGLLVLGAAGAAAVGDIKDAIVITVVLVINAMLGVVQESRAERSLDALRSMLTPTAKVRRDGKIREVDATLLVPGDVVLLEAGDRVPADGRVVVAYDVSADESSLTGESMAVHKFTEPVESGTALGDRSSMLWMNTTLTRGRAEIVVTATGMSTEMGRIAALLASADDVETPLAKQLDGLGKRLAMVAGAAMLAYLGVGMLRGETFREMIGSAIGLAVAAVPEGLPAVVTVTLSLGVHHVAKRGAVVKNLASVETLGSTSTICSDKTGTLTMNRMTAVELQGFGERLDPVAGHDLRGTPWQRLIEAASLASDAVVDDSGPDRVSVGDPTEVGIVELAADQHLDIAPYASSTPASPRCRSTRPASSWWWSSTPGKAGRSCW
ncbi:MAG: HAD-IC family P-type ATPase [Microthrixaceae bacterium]